MLSPFLCCDNTSGAFKRSYAVSRHSGHKNVPYRTKNMKEEPRIAASWVSVTIFRKVMEIFLIFCISGSDLKDVSCTSFVILLKSNVVRYWWKKDGWSEFVAGCAVLINSNIGFCIFILLPHGGQKSLRLLLLSTLSTLTCCLGGHWSSPVRRKCKIKCLHFLQYISTYSCC